MSALDAANKKGRQAYRDGKPRENPYPDLRTRHGAVTFSRAFRREWFRGYDDEKKAPHRK